LRLQLVFLCLWTFTLIQAKEFTSRALFTPVSAVTMSGGQGALWSSSMEMGRINPAMISDLPYPQFTLSIIRLSWDRSYASAMGMLNNKGILLGLSFWQFKISDIEARDINGDFNGNFEDETIKFGLLLGKKIGKFSIGTHFGLLSEAINNQSADAFIFDIGATYRFAERSVVGYSLNHFNLPGLFSGDGRSRLQWQVKQADDKETRFDAPIGMRHSFTWQHDFIRWRIGISYHWLEGTDNEFNLAFGLKLVEHIELQTALHNGRLSGGFNFDFIFIKRHGEFAYALWREKVTDEYFHCFTCTLF